MSKIIVNHAIEITPDKIWYPFIKKQFESLGHDVVLLKLPQPSAPNADEWFKELEREVSKHDAADTVLVGHSLGGLNILRFLHHYDAGKKGKLAGVVLVATMAHEVGYDFLKPFFEDWDWANIKSSARHFRLLTAIDDPVLVPDPMKHVRTILEGTNGYAKVAAVGGHFPVWTPDTPPVLPELQDAVQLIKECLPNRQK